MKKPILESQCIYISRATEIAKKLLYDMDEFATEDERRHLESHLECRMLVARQMNLTAPARVRKTINEYEALILRRVKNQSRISSPPSNASQIIEPQTDIYTPQQRCVTEEEAEALNSQWNGDGQTIRTNRSEEILRHLRIDKCISCQSKLMELPHVSILSIDTPSLDLARYVETHIEYA